MQYCLHWVLLTSVFAGKFYLRFFSVAIRVSLFSFKRTLYFKASQDLGISGTSSSSFHYTGGQKFHGSGGGEGTSLLR